MINPKLDTVLLTLNVNERRVIRAFVYEVNRRAEEKMLKTGKLEGSHHAAMVELLKELGI